MMEKESIRVEELDQHDHTQAEDACLFKGGKSQEDGSKEELHSSKDGVGLEKENSFQWIVEDYKAVTETALDYELVRKKS